MARFVKSLHRHQAHHVVQVMIVQTLRRYVAVRQALVIVELHHSVLVYLVRLRLNVMMAVCGVVHTNVRTLLAFYLYGG